jgi:hypothetical protein
MGNPYAPLPEKQVISNVKTETVLKLAGQLLIWLVMGIWFTAKISTGFDAIAKDVRSLERTVTHLSDRLDNHIENSRKDK